jgi:hypothetical protein
LIAAAGAVLERDEEVVDLTTGMMRLRRRGYEVVRRGTLFATDRRVILFAKKLRGRDVDEYAYGALTSVDHQKGLVFGDIELAAADQRAWISQVPKDEVEGIVATIREYMELARGHAPTPIVASPPVDVSTAIRKLAELRDDGVITEEQFETKKRLLIGFDARASEGSARCEPVPSARAHGRGRGYVGSRSHVASQPCQAMNPPRSR